MTGRFRPDLKTSGCSGVVGANCISGNTQKLQPSFQCLKKIDNFLIKEKQAHYFDEKQLVSCQLDTEFTLLVKFAAGSDVFFPFFLSLFFYEWVLKDYWLSTDELSCPLCAIARYYFSKSFARGIANVYVCVSRREKSQCIKAGKST